MVCRHLIINICILFFSASGAYGIDFSKCQAYYQNATKRFGEITAIHLGEGLYLAYSNKRLQDDKKMQNSRLSKSSPLLSLYLFKDTALPYKFDPREIKADVDVVAINGDSISHGKILQNQASIKDLGVFSVDLRANSVISDVCCQVYRISIGGNGFIDKKYIDLFLSQDSIAYSYIGIGINDNLEVKKINPLIIKHINDKNIDSAISAMLGDSGNIQI